MNLPDRIQDLNYNLLKLSSLVETNIKDAFSAIEKKDLDKSKTVVNVCLLYTSDAADED